MTFRQLWISVRRSIMRRAQDDRDLDDEIGFHLAQETRLRVERGTPAGQAEREARRAFGSVALARENTRTVWISRAREQLVQDLVFGCRIVTRSPALGATAVLLVALVIGGNTTVFSIAHGILNKPAMGVHGAGLVTVNWIDDDGRGEPGTSFANYQDLAAASVTLRPMLAVRPFGRFTLNHDRGSHAVNGGLVSTNYFETLGVTIPNGRPFTPADEAASSGLVAVISHRAWQDLFQSGEDVIGTPIIVNGHPATVVGVAAPGFRGTMLGESADVWLPFASYTRANGQAESLVERVGWGILMNARLAPGRSIAEARAEITAIWARLQAAHPDLTRLRITLMPYSAVAGTGTGLADQGDRLLAILSIVTLVTLVIVCANVANLLLARAVSRQREMALRQSLGASRVRIVRLLFAEGLVISCLAAAAAFLCAWWVARGATGFMAPGPWGQVAMMDFTPDWTVAAYALALAAVAVLAFTLAPAIRAWRLDLLPWLKAGEQGVVQGRSRLSGALVVIQLAFSVLLLTCAGLAYRSLFLMGSVDPGFDSRNLLRVTVNTSGSASSPETNAVLIDTLGERVRAVAGVEHVTYARLPLFRDGGWGMFRVSTPGSATEPFEAERNHVGPDYLQAVGVRPVVGRDFAARDRRRAARSAIVSENLADAVWPGQSPLGRTLLVRPGHDPGDSDNALQEVEVVGVTPNGYFSGFRRQPRMVVLLSFQEDPAPPGEVTFHVRYTGSLEAVAPAITRALADADRRVPIVSMRTMDAQLDNALWPVRVITMLLAVFAAGSLVIAGIGQYAVVAFDMRRRLREIGLRMALGASSEQVLRSVVQEGFRLTAIGLAVGFALSLATGRGLGGVLFGITPTDAATYLGVFGLLTAASLMACYLPARRAARINPITVLRHE